MNRNFKIYLILWILLLAIFNVAVFVSPAEMGGMNRFAGAFWAGYIFITLAFFGQLVCAYITLKNENLKKLFYSIPVIRISYTGLILTLIFGVLCMVIPNLPNWVGIILCFAVLAFNAMSVAKAKLAGDIVAETDDKVKTQTFFIRSLTVDAESLLARAKSDEAKAACKKVYEAARYSDPMSHDALAYAESEITLKFAKLTEAVAADENVAELAEEVVILLGDRNKKCRLLK